MMSNFIEDFLYNNLEKYSEIEKIDIQNHMHDEFIENIKTLKVKNLNELMTKYKKNESKFSLEDCSVYIDTKMMINYLRNLFRKNNFNFALYSLEELLNKYPKYELINDIFSQIDFGSINGTLFVIFDNDNPQENIYLIKDITKLGYEAHVYIEKGDSIDIYDENGKII